MWLLHSKDYTASHDIACIKGGRSAKKIGDAIVGEGKDVKAWSSVYMEGMPYHSVRYLGLTWTGTTCLARKGDGKPPEWQQMIMRLETDFEVR
jgi:hypothetical protein